ncbi:MAG: hypothetical protein KJ043_21160, partial [Anaerolineae bacterium]|nr:hypothetical protein [Anaerolineae bacterium]
QLVRWHDIEPSQGDYQWATWDAIINTFQDYPELELVVVFVDVPQWATQHPYDLTSQRTAPPDNPQIFADFIGMFANRYQAITNYYQIWDEPNITLGWGNLEPNVAHYVAMLQSAYITIHQNDPSAYVISAGLAPTIETGPTNYNEVDFMLMMYAHGAKEYADAWAGMPYGFEHSPQDRIVDVNHLNASRFVMLREIMVDNDDAHKPLWASAWGWNALPESWTGRPSIWRDVTQSQQIQYTLDLLGRAEREWTWLGGMILYHWQPSAEAENPIWGFSIIAQDDSITPLYEALKNRTITAMDGLYPAQNPSAIYSGAWTFTNIGADIGWVQDSSAEFRFLGRDIAIITREEDAIAHFYITVDDQPANALPRDMAGNSYLSLRSGELSPMVDVRMVARNLPDGEHTLHLIADEVVPDEIQLGYPLVGLGVGRGA